MQLTISCNDRDKVETSKLAIAHYCAALQYEQEEEQRFVDKVVSEVTSLVRYVQTDMYRREDQHCLVNEMEIFSKFSFPKDKHNHPIFAVITGAYLSLGFKYYDLVVKVTNERDFVKSRHYHRVFITSFAKSMHTFTIRKNPALKMRRTESF